MSTKDARSEVEAFEAALEFIALYELSGDELSDADSDAASAGPARPVKDLTARFQSHRAHSLEPPPDSLLSMDESVVDRTTADELEQFFASITDVSSALGGSSSHSAAGQVDVAAQFSDAGAISTAASSPEVARSGTAVTSTGARRLDSATARLLKLARPAKSVSRRQELQELRETVKSLTAQLESLQSPSLPLTDEASSYVCSLLSECESVWEQLAARQLEARRTAEAKNQHLWTVVDQQVRFAKNLKRKLRRQTRDSDVGRVFTLKRFKPLTPQESEGVLADLERSMDELYVGIDKQFKDANMDSLPCPGRKRQARRDAINGVFIDLLDSNLVPFELHTTENAVWLSFGERGLRYRHGRSLTLTTNSESDNTIMSSYQFDVKAFDNYHRVQCHRVARKYVKEVRSVIVCQTTIEPFQQTSGDRVGLKFIETQLLTVTQDAQTPSHSVIRSLMRITRLELDGEPVKRYRADAYIDIAIDGWNQSKSIDNQLIENLLMEELLAVR